MTVQTNKKISAEEMLSMATTFTIIDIGDRLPLKIELRDPEMKKWAITKGTENLGKNGKWTHEPFNSSKTNSFLKNHRYDLEEAMEKALEIKKEYERFQRLAEATVNQAISWGVVFPNDHTKNEFIKRLTIDYCGIYDKNL